MDYQILPILDPAQVARLLAALAAHPFVDGKATASGIAREVKENRQAERSTGPAAQTLAELDQIVITALCAHRGFQGFAFPRRVRPPIFSRYEPGMHYGSHVDAAYFNDQGSLVRADLSVTLFLSDPTSYEGGELLIQQSYGEEAVKLQAGEAVIYSSETVHRVAPVTRGVRIAAVTWVQSAVRDPRIRTLLFDLAASLKKLEQGEDPALLLAKSYNNLLRLSADL
jgi:PKHD-type hydroxylase